MKTPRPWQSLWSCHPSPSQHCRYGKAYDHTLTANHHSPYTLLHTPSTHSSNVIFSFFGSPGLSSPPCPFDLVAEVRVARQTLANRAVRYKSHVCFLPNTTATLVDQPLRYVLVCQTANHQTVRMYDRRAASARTRDLQHLKSRPPLLTVTDV